MRLISSCSLRRWLCSRNRFSLTSETPADPVTLPTTVVPLPLLFPSKDDDCVVVMVVVADDDEPLLLAPLLMALPLPLALLSEGLWRTPPPLPRLALTPPVLPILLVLNMPWLKLGVPLGELVEGLADMVWEVVSLTCGF